MTISEESLPDLQKEELVIRPFSGKGASPLILVFFHFPDAPVVASHQPSLTPSCVGDSITFMVAGNRHQAFGMRGCEPAVRVQRSPRKTGAARGRRSPRKTEDSAPYPLRHGQTEHRFPHRGERISTPSGRRGETRNERSGVYGEYLLTRFFGPVLLDFFLPWLGSCRMDQCKAVQCLKI